MFYLDEIQDKLKRYPDTNSFEVRLRQSFSLRCFEENPFPLFWMKYVNESTISVVVSLGLTYPRDVIGPFMCLAKGFTSEEVSFTK